MSSELLERRFAAIGARVKVPADGWRGAPQINVRTDRRGEYFDLGFTGAGDPVDVDVVDVAPEERHLLLLVRDGKEKSKFLCGYDERHWFVAAVPESARGVTGVAAAKAALQPDEVREAADGGRRKRRAYLRQGEWFFVPAPDLEPPDDLVLRDEPLSRGRGTPHVMELAYRRGGHVVYVGPYGGTMDEERFLRQPENVRKGRGWQRMVAEPEVYAKGAIRHPDHATIVLAGWHRVLMNTEQSARAMRHIVFLD